MRKTINPILELKEKCSLCNETATSLFNKKPFCKEHIPKIPRTSRNKVKYLERI